MADKQNEKIWRDVWEDTLQTLLLDDGGSDHLIEGIVFAIAGWCNVHGGSANILLLEAGLEQMRYLGLLENINK